MKRITILLGLFAVLSCTNNELVDVTFKSSVESGALTKATRIDTVQRMVSQRIPKTMDLSIVSKRTGKTYLSETNSSVLLPIGMYDVSGITKHTDEMQVTMNSAFANNPLISVDETVGIVSGKNAYQLNARFVCFGLVIDTKEVSGVEVYNEIGEDIVPFQVQDNYGIVFVNGELGSDNINLRIIPKNKENGDTKELSFSGIPKEGCIAVEMGKYYVLHPTIVEKMESGFMLNLPPMGEVDLK